MHWQLLNYIRVLLTMLGAFLLGLAAANWLHHDVPVALRVGVVGFCLLLLAMAAGWLIRWLVLPFRPAGRGAASLEELPRLWTELERENLTLRELGEAEDALRRGILSQLQEGVIVLGPGGTVQLYNPAAEFLLGRGSALVKGASSASLFREPEAQRQLALMQTDQDAEWQVQRGHRILRVRGIPFGLDQGGGMLLTLDDVTRQEALENTRQRFISNLSHELRTPLTSLRIAVENLQAEQTQSGQTDGNVAMLLRAVERMTLLLEDISELSRIESGALRLNPGPTSAKVCIGELLDEFRPLAEAKGIELISTCSLPEDARFTVDALRLHQLVGNLLSNAIKFSPADSRVELRLTASPGRMRWEVSDQGPGIAPGDQAKVFERFFRAATVRGIPGTGLGLAIVKHLARLMDGEVGFTSTPGQGTTFWVELPSGEV